MVIFKIIKKSLIKIDIYHQVLINFKNLQDIKNLIYR
jgi:hypothetical protein